MLPSICLNVCQARPGVASRRAAYKQNLYLKHFFQQFDLCPGIKCQTDSIVTSSRSCKTCVKKFEKEMKMKLLHDQAVKYMLKFNTKVLDSSV